MEKKSSNRQWLRELEKRYKLFYDYAPLPYQSLDENINIIDVNQTWLDLLGYAKEDVIGRPFGEYLVLQSRKLLNSRFSHFKEVGEIQDNEYEIIKKNGSHGIIWLDGRIEYDKNGNFRQAHCFFKDITERKQTEKKLKESEKRYRSFLENFQGIAFQGHLDFTPMFFHGNVEEITGYNEKEFIAQNPRWDQIILDEDKEHLEKSFNQIHDVPNVVIEREYRIITRDGVKKWIQENISNISDENGEPYMVQGIINEITDRKKTEQSLKESEEKFRNITEHSFMSIYIIQDGYIRYRNQRSTDLSGYSSDDIKTWEPYEYAKLIHPDDREFVMEQSRKKQEGDRDVINRYKYRIIKKSGEIVWLDNFSKSIIYNGKAADLVMTEDITEKIVAEHKLKESEEKFKYIFNNSQVGLYWSNISDGKFVECNETFVKLFGYNTREELLEDYIATEHYVYPNQRNEILDAIRIYNEVRGYEILVTKKDGTPIWLSISAQISDKENRIEGAAIDITKRKKAEQELLESEERYRKAYDKADFYKDLLAHDVGNILNNISASVQLMKIWTDDINISMKERNMMGIIKQQLERGASLVSNVRKLSEIEEGEPSVKSIDAKKIIKNCIENVRSRFHEKGLEINFDTFQEVANVLGGDLLIDAFENLIINGVIHNDSENIKLWVNLSKISQEGKEFVKFEFKDNGIGIIEDRKKTIFKRNYRKDRSTGGMGIGLSLVKNIIKIYRGQTWVENRVLGDYSKGSNFIVLLKEE